MRQDGSRFWALAALHAVRDDTGDLIGFAKITRDNTERLEAQLALERAREQLFQSQKLEAVGHLTGGVAHDFNNLLTVVRGSAELAERYAVGNERLGRLLHAIRSATDRGARLTGQLLAFSRKQMLQPGVIEAGAQVRSIAELIEASLRAGIVLEIEGCEQPIWIDANSRHLELALLNIGLNARDAMPDGGTLRIAVTRRRLIDDCVAAPGEYAAISLTDTGSGIAPEVLDRVIEPFFTTKEVGKGSGLGLSQAYGFAKQSGGGLTVESTPGQGTCITVYLPLGVPAENVEPVQTVPGAAEARSRGRVLVVEDEAPAAMVAIAALEQAGFEVCAVTRAREALALLDQGEPFDLVFSDVMMPGMSGFDLARTLRERRPKLPILLVTGFTDAAASEEASGTPVLAKPYDTGELAEQAARLIKLN